MGWLGDFLFGKGDKSTTTPTSTLTPEQTQIAQALQKALGITPNQFEGDLAAPLSGLETMSLDALENMINTRMQAGTDVNVDAMTKINDLITQLGSSGAGNMDEATELEGTASDTLTRIMQSSGTDIEALLGAFEDSARADFEENVLPSLDRKFANRFFSSDRSRAEDTARRNFGRDLTTTRADLGFKTRMQDIQDKLAAAGLVPQLEASRAGRGSDRVSQLMQALGLSDDLATGSQNRELALLMAGLEGGGIARNVENERLKGEFDKFLANQGIGSDRIAQMLQFLGTPMLENIVTVKKGKKGLIPGALESFITGAAGGLGSSMTGGSVLKPGATSGGGSSKFF